MLDEKRALDWQEAFIDGSFAPAKKGGPLLGLPNGAKERSGWWWLAADRGFDQSYKKQKHCRRRWGVKRLAIAKRGKKPHRDSDASWFKQALKQRVKIEPVIGHLKADHRMDRCRYKGPEGDTANVLWACAAWNMRKVTRIQAAKQARAAKRKTKRAA